MNSILQQLSPLPSEYPLPSDSECLDALNPHAHHSSFASNSIRRDGALGASANLLSLPSNGLQRGFVATQRSATHDSQYATGSSIQESGSGLTSSPSSHSSTLASYPQYYSHQYSAPSQIYSSYGQTYAGISGVRPRISSITDLTAGPVMLPPARSPAIINPASPTSLSANARENYTTSTPGLSRHPLSPRSHSDYHTGPDIPRSMIPTGAGSYAYSAGLDPRNPETPPFDKQQDLCEIWSETHQKISPLIHAKIEKGFFLSQDQCWTCYRRNYFSVQCFFSLDPHIPGGRMYLSRRENKTPEMIQAMAMSLSATVDGTGGKSVELVQHTPKRDKGPQTAIKVEKLAPTPPGRAHGTNLHTEGYGMNPYHPGGTSSQLTSPYLPCQTQADSIDPSQSPPSSSVPSSYMPTHTPHHHHNTPTNTQHTFERIQFKSATANNGKRRAQQQYYHLIVELYADVRTSPDKSPEWIKIAQVASAAVVVRGRSPSHYSHDGPHSANSRGGAPTAGAGAGPGAGLTPLGRGSMPGFGLSGGTMGIGGYRSTAYSLNPSPIGSHSVSSASSLSGGQADAGYSDSSGRYYTRSYNEDERAHHFRTYDGSSEEDEKIKKEGYQYYPGPLYETGILPPVRRIEQQAFAEPAKKDTDFVFDGCGGARLGVESSRGWYSGPDLGDGFGN